MKRFLLAVLILGVVAAIALLNYQLSGQLQQQEETQAVQGEVITVGKGTIAESVDTSGRILPEKQALVGFETSGRVKELLVTVGQKVKQGDVLARLETSDLEMALADAQASLQQSEASLAQTKVPATPKEIAAARASVESAQSAYDKTLAGPDPNTVISNKAALKTAELTLRAAQEAYDQVAYKADIGMSSQAQTLQQASIDYEKALADYNLSAEGPTEQEKKSAAATLASAESSLDTLLRKPLPEDIAASEAAVTKARNAVEKARVDLQNAELKSPIDGTVVEVNVRVGEVPSESTAIILVDDSRLHVYVGVDEIDVSRIEVGQPVSVTLEALPDQEFSGQVESISPSTTDSATLLQSPASTSAGVPTYVVSIALTNSNPKVRVGMSASATIQTQIHEGVPVIPTGDIQVDSAGKKYVNKLDSRDLPVHTEITTGLSDDTYTEVLSGLAVGDRVLVGTTSTRSTTGTNNRQQGGPPGGGFFLGR
jgi:HlyD family secretion protein